MEGMTQQRIIAVWLNSYILHEIKNVILAKFHQREKT